MTAACFPPAKLSANRAIGNWLAALSQAPVPTDDAVMDADATYELETLATCVAREIASAYEIGVRRGIAAAVDILAGQAPA